MRVDIERFNYINLLQGFKFMKSVVEISEEKKICL